jgi:hypothetical protein
MSTLELTAEERIELLEILEGSHYRLRVEIANTDDREFRRHLKQREATMKVLIERLKSS